MMTKKAKRRMIIVACIDLALKTLFIGVAMLLMLYMAAKFTDVSTPVARQWLWDLHYALMALLG